MATLAKYLLPLFLSPPEFLTSTSSSGNNEGSLLSLPPLRKDTPNIVYMYYGSFNPPHVGHIALLHAVLENTKDWNVVGVLVWCMSDHWLKDKIQSPTLVLSQQQRAALWRNDPRLPANVWVVEDALFCTDDPGVIWDWIVEAAEWDGFEIRWTDIMGPDRHMSGRWEGRRQPSNKRGLVVCDVSRKCGYLDEAGFPRQGKADSEWTKINVTTGQKRIPDPNLKPTHAAKSLESLGTAGKDVGEFMSTTLSCSSNFRCESKSRFESSTKASTVMTPGTSDSFSISRPVIEGPTNVTDGCSEKESAVADPVAVWECYNIKKPECRTRLICKMGRKRADSSESLTEELSSTKIRQLIESSEGNCERDQLDALVLSPKLFKGFVREYKQGSRTTDPGFRANQ